MSERRSCKRCVCKALMKKIERFERDFPISILCHQVGDGETSNLPASLEAREVATMQA